MVLFRSTAILLRSSLAIPRSLSFCTTSSSSYTSSGSRGRLPYFLGDHQPEREAPVPPLLTEEVQTDLYHMSLCDAVQKRMRKRCIFADDKDRSDQMLIQNFNGFYLTTNPFHIVVRKTDRRSKWKTILLDFWRAFTNFRIRSITGENNVKKSTLNEAFEQAVKVISQKISEKRGSDLVTLSIMTDTAWKSIEPKLKELSDKQLEVFNISSEDFVLPQTELFDVEVRFSEGKAFADYSLLDVALFDAAKIDYNEQEKKMYVQKDYPFDLPKQIILNLVFTRQIAPTVENYVVSQFNFIAVP